MRRFNLNALAGNRRGHGFSIGFILCSLLIPGASAAGTWTPLTTAPPIGVNNCLLLSDGTVLAMNGGGQCAKLTPDIHGSYINGTWTMLETMNSSRLFFASDVLTNGNVFVAGGEYGDPNHYDAEVYNPQAGTWTVVPGSPTPNFNYSDSPSEMLTNGNLLVSDSQSGYNFYNTASNVMVSGGSCGDMNETCWVKLPNGAIFGIDNYGAGAEHFAPSVNQWIVDSTSTPSGAQDGDDACYLLPNGQIFHVGSTTNTCFYTPGATQTSAGTLVNGPNLPINGGNQLYGGESPGAMLVTGNVLLELAPDGGGAASASPSYFYEYDYVSQTFTPESAPGGGSTYNTSPFVNSMLDLPDGSVLFVGGQNSTSMYVYQPGGTPLAAGLPVISSITENADGSYLLTGTGFDGISEGAVFGDDEQMACDFPLVRLTNQVSGNVYYARTYNWTPGRVMTGTNVLNTEFVLPPNLPAGTYSLLVTAVGHASSPLYFFYSPVTPATPTGLAGSAVGSYAYLTWNVSPGATSYSVNRSTVSGGPYTAVATNAANITTYTDPTLTNGITYYYVVSAANGAGQSANSSQASVTGPIMVTTTNEYGSLLTYPFTPSWNVVTNGNLILGQPPATALGNGFSLLPAYSINTLTSGGDLAIESVMLDSGGNTISANYLSFGNDGSGQTLIYTLSSTLYGCTVTNITVYGGSLNSGDDQQCYNVYYSTTSNPQNFIPLTSVNYIPSGVPAATPVATRVTIAPTTPGGVLASNVAAIAFFWPANLPLVNGDSAYAQFAVLGTPGSVSTTAANEYGSTNAYPFTPDWSVVTNGDLILDQAPSTASGDFNNWAADVGVRNVNFLTGSGNLTINQVAGVSGVTPSTNYVTCGNDGSGATVIYTMPNPVYGCTVTNITVYGGWQDNGRDEQAYTIYYSTIAAPANFIYFATVHYLPAAVPDSTPSATRVTLSPTAPGGVLLNNVAAVKFDFTSPPSENGDCGYAEIAVLGFQDTLQAPTIGPPKRVAGNLIITGTGGTPNSDYTWLFTTNLTPPVIWATNSTGTLNSAGAFSNAIPINSRTHESFFRLRLP